MTTRSKGAIPKSTRPIAPKQTRRKISAQFGNEDDGNDMPNLMPAPTRGESPTTISSISIPGTQPLTGFETPTVSQQQVHVDVHQEDIVDMNVTNQERDELEGAVGGGDNRNIASSSSIQPNRMESEMDRNQREQMNAFTQMNAYKPSFVEYERWLAAYRNRSAPNAAMVIDHVASDNERQSATNNQTANGNEIDQAANESVAIDNDVRRALANEYQAPATDEATTGINRSVFTANPNVQLPTNSFRQPPTDAIRVAMANNGKGRTVIDIRTLYLRRLDEYKRRLHCEAIGEVELKTMLENTENYVGRIIKHVEEREDSRLLNQCELDANQALWEQTTELGDFIKLNIRTKLVYLQAGTQPSVQQQSKVAHARRLLAKIEPFGGEWELWPNFKSKWVEYYHNCTDMTPMDLLFKLDEFIVPRSEAYNLIATYERALPASYQDAWDCLCKTYDNPRRQVNDIIDKFMSMPIIKHDRSSYLCAQNHINSLIKTLPRMGVDVTTWDPILMHVLEHKLDAVSKREWKEHRAAREVAQLKPFLDFLLQQIDSSDDTSKLNASAPSRDHSRDRWSNMVRNHSSDRHSNQNRHATGDHRPNQNERRGNGNQSSNQPSRAGQSSSSNGNQRQQNYAATNNAPRLQSKIVRPKKCPVCPNAEHSIYACPEFNQLNRDGRINRINKLKLCHNCLRSKCTANQCTLGNCPNGCNAKHNRLICTKTFTPTVNAVQQAEGSQQ